MVFVGNPVLFNDALAALSSHKRSIGGGFKGRFIQVFLGLKYFQNGLPTIFSGGFVTSEVLQSQLDDLYRKVSRQPNDSILSVFEGNFLARTGLIGVGNDWAQNTWRNNFNIQKGIGCYASSPYLSDMAFLDQPRVDCGFLQPATAGSLIDARCSLCPTGGYRRESHRKWLHVDPDGHGYAVTELDNIPNFVPYVAPDGRRIPVLPLIIALYHDADPSLLGARPSVNLAEFMADFNLSQAEFDAYFDAGMGHPGNIAVVESAGWNAGATLGAPLAVQPPPLPAPRTVRRPGVAAPRPPRQLPTHPILNGTPVPPPAANTGYDAEQYVAAALVADGWTVHVVTRQQIGYDIYATKRRQIRYVEVKSSLGYCSPSLTAREWHQAQAHQGNYILAIIENFNPLGDNTIYWIPDPANVCIATPQTTISHSIARGSWGLGVVPIDLL